MKKFVPDIVLLSVASVCVAALNLYAPLIRNSADLTILLVALILIAISYRQTLVFTKRIKASLPITILYTGLVASIIIFFAGQIIRLVAAALYILTFANDAQGFALQMRFVLPNFIGGTFTAFSFVVASSFALGFLVVLPLIWYRHFRVR